VIRRRISIDPITVPPGCGTVYRLGSRREPFRAPPRNAIAMERIRFVTDHVPWDFRWYWRRRFTSWFLRRVLRRRRPTPGPDMQVSLRLRDEDALSVELSGRSTHGVIEMGDPVLIRDEDAVTFIISNREKEPIRIDIALEGFAPR
jgi:hypothetical protein